MNRGSHPIEISYVTRVPLGCVVNNYLWFQHKIYSYLFELILHLYSRYKMTTSNNLLIH